MLSIVRRIHAKLPLVPRQDQGGFLLALEWIAEEIDLETEKYLKSLEDEHDKTSRDNTEAAQRTF